MNLFRELFERIGNALRAAFGGANASEPSSTRHVRVHENYLRRLEDDVARLRAENRALLNSLLGTAGIPPLEIPGGDGATRPAAMPTRRRSWPQIAHSLETIARNTPAHDAMSREAAPSRQSKSHQ
ncbi:MAG: hypothetical protein WAM91_13285 [Candidatus Acidiferrales bacterium]